MNERKIIYLIYRDRETKQITRYSIINNIPPDIDYHIKKFNSSDVKSTVEIVSDKDHIALICIAEEKSLIKDRDLRNIESAIDRLQEEVFILKDRIKETK